MKDDIYSYTQYCYTQYTNYEERTDWVSNKMSADYNQNKWSYIIGNNYGYNIWKYVSYDYKYADIEWTVFLGRYKWELK